MKRKIYSLIIALVLPLILLGCNKNDNVGKQQEKEKVIETKNYSLICPDGLPAIAASKFMNEASNIKNMKLNTSIQKSTDLLLSEFMKGEADFAIVPSNLALQSYKKNLGYKVVGTVGWGSLYLVTTEGEKSISDIKGNEIYNTGKGLTPDIIFKEVLNKNDISESDVTLSYVGAASEIAPMLLAGKIQYAVLPEPVLSTVQSKNPNIKVICSLNDEWKQKNNSENGYPQSTLLIKDSVYNEIKDTDLYKDIVNKFTECEKNVVDDPKSIIEICKDLEITINPETISAAIKNSNLDFTPANKSKEDYIKYFNLINENKEDNYDSLFVEK